MSPSAAFLAGLQFELAMALSNTLDLEELLEGTLAILLHRLDARSAAVYADLGSTRMERVTVLPRRSEAPLEFAPLAGDAAHHSLALPPSEAGEIRREVFRLPGYGALLIDKLAPGLDQVVLAALEPIMLRLGLAARACATHTALEESEGRYAQLVSSLPEVVFEARQAEDGSLLFDFVSGRARQLLGVAPERLQDDPRAFLEIIEEDDRLPLRARLRTALAYREPLDQRVRATVLGERRWLRIYGAPSDAGTDGSPRWRGLIEDVTANEQLVRAEREASNLRLSAMLSAVDDAIVGGDDQGRITHWNRGAEQLLGYSAEEATGRMLELIIPERLREGHRRGLAHHLATGETKVVGQPIELPALHARGFEVPVELLLSRVVDGDRVFFIAMLRDMTDRRRIERERAARVEAERRFASSLVQLSQSAYADASAIGPQITRSLAEALNADSVGLWRIDELGAECLDAYETQLGHHQLHPQVLREDDPDYFAELDAGRTIAADLAEQLPVLERTWERDLRPRGIQSALHTPVLSLEGTIGMLRVESLTAREWQPEELRFCDDVAELAARGFERQSRLALEARHRVILSSIGEAILACDREGRVAMMNPSAEQLTGWTAAAALGARVHDVVRLVDHDRNHPLSLVVEEVLAGRACPAGSSRQVLERHDGATVAVSVAISPILDRGELDGLAIIFRDVTEEERIQDEIRRQYRRLRAIGAALPDGLFIASDEGHLINAKAGDTPLDELRESDRNVHTEFPPGLAEEVLGSVRRAIATGEVQAIEYEVQLPEGRRAFEARLARISDTEVTSIVRDVTEELERSRALDDERTRLATVLGSTSAIIYSARWPDMKLEYISDSASAVLGYRVEDFHDPDFWPAAIHPDDRRRVMASIVALPRKGRLTHEYRHRHASGGYRWLRDELRLLRDGEGNPTAVVGASFDITDRRIGESRLATLLRVQQIVSQLSASLLTHEQVRVNAAINEALEELGRQTQADRAYVFLLRDGALDNTHEWCADDIRPRISERLRRAPQDFEHILRPIEGGHSLYIDAVSALPDEAVDAKRALEAEGIESALIAPLTIDGRLEGFVALDNPHFDPLDPREYGTLLQLLADTLGAGIRRVQGDRELRGLHDALTKRADKQQQLLELSTALARAGSRDEILSIANSALVSILEVDRVSLVEVDAESGDLEVRMLDTAEDMPVADGSDGGAHKGDALWRKVLHRLDPAEIGGWSVDVAMRERRLVSTREFDTERFADWSSTVARGPLRQFVVVPLVGSRGVFGTLNTGSRASQPPSAEDEGWISQFAAVFGAHLMTQQALGALADLNQALESRVEDRTSALKASEERFERLFQYAPQAMLIVDDQLRVVQSNRNARMLFEQELDDETPGSLEGFLPDLDIEQLGELAVRDGDPAGVRPTAAAPEPLKALRSGSTEFFAEVGLSSIRLGDRPHTLLGLTDVTARLAAEAEVVRSLREKETLLKEIHHRVKNNLQIISSLLSLQSEQVDDERLKAPLQESVLRVRSMALIHQQLYGVESLDRIDLGHFAYSLANSLRSVLAPHSRLRLECEPVEITVELALPLGLILNELITNAFKYGVADPASSEPRRTGQDHDVAVEVGLVEDGIRVAVTDGGPGLSEGIDAGRGGSLGMQLIASLTRQIRGQLTYDHDRGSRFVLDCPQPDSTTDGAR
jgi:PAS domain S-box-containing protein